MIDLVVLLEGLIKVDMLKTPMFVTMKSLRDAITAELGPRAGRVANLYRAKVVATKVVAEMKIDVSEEFLRSEDFQKIIDLTAKLVGNIWDATVPEFGDDTFLIMAKKVELVCLFDDLSD